MGTKEGTPSRLKTANREENGRFVHKKVVFCGQSADFGRFVHKKAVFCGQSSDLNAAEAAGKGCGINLSSFVPEKAPRAACGGHSDFEV